MTKSRRASCGCSVFSLSTPTPCALRQTKKLRRSRIGEEMEHSRIQNLRPQHEEKLRPWKVRGSGESPHRLFTGKRFELPNKTVYIHRQSYRMDDRTS